MPPGWLVALATAGVALGFLSAAILIAMLFVRPQKMTVMDLVWPATGLYWGPAAPWALWRYGTPPVSPAALHEEERTEREQREAKPFWAAIVVATTHCGAGCTLGDIIGEWLIRAFGWSLFGNVLYAEYFVDFGLAYLLGIFFQYFTIAPMRGLGLRDGLVAAAKADTISIVAFEIGLFAWMALIKLFLFPHEGIDSWNHWFQIRLSHQLSGELVAAARRVEGEDVASYGGLRCKAAKGSRRHLLTRHPGEGRDDNGGSGADQVRCSVALAHPVAMKPSRT